MAAVAEARWLVGLAVAGLLAAPACGGDDDAASGTTTSTTTTTEVAAHAPAVDWRDVDDPVDLGDGWGLEPCEGDAPIVCITRGGERAGLVELLSFPVDTLPEVAEALAAGDEAAALDAHAEAYLRDIGDDRRRGCPDGYRFQPGKPRHVTTADGQAITYRFSGTFADGRASEQTIQYAGIRDGSLVIINVAGYEPDSCPSSEGQELSSSEVDGFAAVLDAVVRANPLPSP